MQDKQSDYYAQARPEMLTFIPPATRRLLDVGCSEGFFGAEVQKMIPDCQIWGIEANPRAAAGAATRIGRVMCGTLADAELPPDHFDVVTMNDVLEHIDYSEPALATVRQTLKPGGHLVISVPNVRYYLNVRDLALHGRWDYQDFGILDRTHLRFFTFSSLRKLLGENGFDVQHVGGINAPTLKPHYRLIFGVVPGPFGDMKFPQIAAVARRS